MASASPRGAIEPLCAALLLTGCLLGGSAAAGRVLPAIPELLALPLVVLTALEEGGPGAPARSRWWIAAVILGLPAVQLVPLPPFAWTTLPGRGPVAEAYAAAGMSLPWLSTSLTPGATERLCLGLLPAVAIFLAVPHLAPGARDRLMHLAVLLGVLDAVLGLAQVAGGPDSPLRFYATASRSDAVGVFANRNHHAAFLALLVVLAGGLLAERGRGSRAERAWLAAAGSLMLPGIAASGSRAGLALGVGACAAVAWILLAGRPAARGRRSGILLGGLVAVPLLAGLAVYGTATLRLGADSVAGDLRWQIARTTWRAVADVFPVGGGLGSFERLYARVERPEDLIPAVVNAAHDDWLELVLEGGLPAALLLAAALAYLVRETLAAGPPAGRAIRGATLAMLWLCAFHATVDYPLRTMAVNLIVALACGLRAVPAKLREGRDTPRRLVATVGSPPRRFPGRPG